MKLTTLLSVLVALTVAAYAQNPNAPGQAKKDEANGRGGDDVVALERTVIDEAIALAKTPGNGNAKKQALDGAEARVLALNEAKPGTAEWRMESAQRLMHLAEQLARAGKPENVADLAERALKHLRIVDTPANRAEARAAAKTLSAWIYERYLADEDAAIADYEAAEQLAPTNAQAKEAATRLKGAKEKRKEKPARGGK